MRGLDMLVIYGLVGMGCALAVATRPDGGRWVEALLLVPFWPLLGPFVLRRSPVDRASASEHLVNAESHDFLDAIERAASTPLGALLPDREAARALARRLETAGAKVREIDRLFGLPEFSEKAAIARHDELRQRGEDAAAATAAGRAQNIRRLRGLRDRWASEIDAVGELIAQLRIQAEVVRLVGESEAGAAEIVDELVARVEGLDAVLEDGALHAT